MVTAVGGDDMQPGGTLQPGDVDSLISVRGLEGPGTRGLGPLREFKGKLKIITPTYHESRGNYRDYTENIMQFTDVEVIATAPGEVYELATHELSLRSSRRTNSRWGIFAESVLKLIPDGQNTPYLYGKVLHLKVTEGHMLFDAEQQKAVRQQAWELVAIEADAMQQAPASATDVALGLLDGRTLPKFYQAALADATIAADSAIQTEVLAKKFEVRMIAEGKVTVDADGVHHRLA